MNIRGPPEIGTPVREVNHLWAMGGLRSDSEDLCGQPYQHQMDSSCLNAHKCIE